MNPTQPGWIRSLTRALFVFTFSFSLFAFAGCAETDPETETGIDRPAVDGLVSGEIKTRRQLADAIEAKNKANAAHRDTGDWRYAKPAVGERE